MLKGYKEYKKINVPWLKSIPSHWDIKRAKGIFFPVNERSQKGKEELLSVSSKYGVIKRKNANVTMFMADSYENYKLCWENDLVINSLWAWQTGLGFSSYHGIISTAYSVFRLKNLDNNCRFLHYLLRGTDYQWELQVRSKGIWRSRYQLSDNSFLDSPIILPPRLEQDQIVRYLDWKLSMINTYINAKKKQIELLKEQRQTVINETVRRGHGQKYRFRHLFTLIKGLNITKADLVDSGVPCVSYGEIHSRYGFAVNPDINALRCVEKKYLKTNLKSLMKYGDFVFADTSEDIAGSGNFTYLNSNTQAFAGYHTIIARPNKVMNYRYLAYFFDSLLFRKQIQQNVNGVKVYSITRSILNDTYIFLPSADEQLSIVALLDEQCERIDKLVGKFNEEIMLFTEYRTRLISDVVTGRVDVQGEKVPEFEMYDQKIIEKEDDE